MNFTTTEHATETTIRVRFDEPVRVGNDAYGGAYEIVNAVVTKSVYQVDENHHPDEAPLGDPYVSVNFNGYRLTSKGKRDGRQDRAAYVPLSIVPDDLRNSLEALVDTDSRVR